MAGGIWNRWRPGCLFKGFVRVFKEHFGQTLYIYIFKDFVRMFLLPGAYLISPAPSPCALRTLSECS